MPLKYLRARVQPVGIDTQVYQEKIILSGVYLIPIISVMGHLRYYLCVASNDISAYFARLCSGLK